MTNTTIQKIIKDFDKKFVYKQTVIDSGIFKSDIYPFQVKSFLTNTLQEVERETKLKTLEMIAQDQGWEESRDYFAHKLGLPLKYDKLSHLKSMGKHKEKCFCQCHNLGGNPYKCDNPNCKL